MLQSKEHKLSSPHLTIISAFSHLWGFELMVRVISMPWEREIYHQWCLPTSARAHAHTLNELTGLSIIMINTETKQFFIPSLENKSSFQVPCHNRCGKHRYSWLKLTSTNWKALIVSHTWKLGWQIRHIKNYSRVLVHLWQVSKVSWFLLFFLTLPSIMQLRQSGLSLKQN